MSRLSRQRLNILVTGGPTRAYLDDVRYVSNVSTGALAYEICQRLQKAGHRVYAVIGPTAFPFEKIAGIKLIPVETNDEMRKEVLAVARKHRLNAAVFSAAVLDFVPKRRAKGKVSSDKKRWNLELTASAKIIDEVGLKHPSIFRVGFKLESRLMTAARARRFAENYLKRKNLDGLCLNFLSEVSAKSHKAVLMDRTGVSKPARSKKQIARLIQSLIERQ